MKKNLYKKENEQKILSLKTDKININLHIKDMDIDNKELVDEFMKLNLKPKLTEKKENGEVFTPKELINEMLDKLPEEVWSNKDLKWFDPAVGMGNFIIEVYWRLMEGLVKQMPDFDKRKKHIVENMLYVSELNEENIKHCDRVFSGQLNIYHGDTLKMPSDYFGVDKFDVIVGNPPYNNMNHNNGHSVWHKFVKYCTDRMKNKGFMVFVHPNGWRKPPVDYSKSKYYDIYDLLVNKNTMLYLEIRNAKDGLKTFQCGTRYDWYVIQNVYNKNYKTIIKDEEGKINKINLHYLKFLPNSNIENLTKILSYNQNDNLKIIYRSGSFYSNNKKEVSKIKTDIFKHPLVHSTSGNKIRYMYSSNTDKGHFNIPKVIFSETSLNCIIDYNSEYGMTELALGIHIESEQEGKNIKKAFDSDKFRKLLSNCKWSNYLIDWRLFTFFKKDFWKEFI